MNRQQFYDRLTELQPKVQFRIDERGRMISRFGLCPIAEVYRSITGKSVKVSASESFLDQAEDIGLGNQRPDQIALAAYNSDLVLKALMEKETDFAIREDIRRARILRERLRQALGIRERTIELPWYQ